MASLARCRLLIVVSMLVAGSVPGLAGELEDLMDALSEVEPLVRSNQYQKIIDLLAPFDVPGVSSTSDPELRYAVAAELGRAKFHLGRYAEANEHFRMAVTLFPQRVESALYLQATSYIIGKREEALAIFREIVRSGAGDLFLAVTLPGERTFLAEPEVWRIVAEHARPLSFDLHLRTFNGIKLGQHRSVVEATLGAAGQGEDPAGRTLAARAGPKLIWAFRFAANGQLEEILIQAEHLLRYTPYRLSFSPQLDWRMTPAQAVAALGAPAASVTDDVGRIHLSWLGDDNRLTLTFGDPAPPRPLPMPGGSAMLLMIQVTRPVRQPPDTDATSGGDSS
jgi:hypothetical protein